MMTLQIWGCNQTLSTDSNFDTDLTIMMDTLRAFESGNDWEGNPRPRDHVMTPKESSYWRYHTARQ
jgi:hypothetical protein